MNNSRVIGIDGRLFVVFLTLIAILCLIPAVVFANVGDGKAEISIGAPDAVSPENGYSPGDLFTVPVVIANNPGFVAANFNFVYDPAVLEVDGMKSQALQLDRLVSETVYPQWMVGFNPADPDQNNTLTVGLQNQPLLAAVSNEDPQIAANGGNRDFTGNGTLFEVTFKVRDDAVAGTYTLDIHTRLDNDKNILNHLLESVPVNYAGMRFMVQAAAPEAAPEDVPSEVPEEVPAEIPGEIPAEVPGDTPEEIPEDVPAEIPDEISEGVDKAALEAAIAAAEALDGTGYTAESWTVFAAALDAARIVAANDFATQEEVDAALIALDETVDAI